MPEVEESQLIRWNEQMHGSLIWNATWKNYSLVQEHALWEIRDRKEALFWIDLWEKMQPLQHLDQLEILHDHMDQDRLLCVADIWKNPLPSSMWQEWKITQEDLRFLTDIDLG